MTVPRTIRTKVGAMIWEGFPHLQLRLLPASDGPAKAASAAVAAPGKLSCVNRWIAIPLISLKRAVTHN